MKKLPKKLATALANFNSEQLQVVAAVMEGRMAVASGCAFRIAPLGWYVHSFDSDSVEHTVTKDLASCSCGDNRFRGRTCKHLQALRKVLC